MNRRHATRRAPKATTGFSWGRFPTDDGSVVTYRLYRRDRSRKIHQHVLSVFTNGDRDTAAVHLRKARKFLRDKVDEIDLAEMGVTA